MKTSGGLAKPHPVVFLAIGAVTAVLSAVALLSTSASAHVFGWFFGSVLGLTACGLTRRAERVRVEEGKSGLGTWARWSLATVMVLSFVLGMVHAFYLGWEWA